MMHDGVEAWAKEQAITLLDAQVDERGYAAGRASTNGRVFLVTFNPSGDYQVCGKPLSEPDPHRPRPSVIGTFVHEGLDRFIARVRNAESACGDESWRVFRLSTAEVLGEVDPKCALGDRDHLERSFAATEVVGTPLTLVHWWWNVSSEDVKRESGSRFALFDAGWKTVWSLQMPRDLLSDDYETRMRYFDAAFRGGSVVRNDLPGSFTLHFSADGQLVTYSVAPNTAAPLGWTVEEVARRPYVAPERPEVPQLGLQEIARHPLQLPWSSESIRDIEAFAFDADGRLRFVRAEKEIRQFTLATLNQQREVADERRIGPLAPDIAGSLEWSMTAQGDWWVIAEPRDQHVAGRALRFDATGNLERSVELNRFAVGSFAAGADGGFVAVVSSRLPINPSTSLVRFDERGLLSWEHPLEVRAGFGSRVAVNKEGSAFLLNELAGAASLTEFSSEGVREATLHPRAPDGLRVSMDSLLVDPHNRLLILDSERGLWLRMGIDGGLETSIDPHKALAAMGRQWCDQWACDRESGLWCSDGDLLVRVDERGGPLEFIGKRERSPTVTSVGFVGFDDFGHIGAIANSTHDLFVFDARGERLSSAEFTPAMFGFNRDTREVGNRLGWTFRAGTHHVERKLEDGSTVRVERRADNLYFADIVSIGVSQDTRVAVLERPDDYELQGDFSVSLYDASGRPLRTVDLPSSRKAVYGATVVLGRAWILVRCPYSARAFLVSARDGRAFEIEVPLAFPAEQFASFSLSPDERELWCVPLGSAVLHRLALPE